MKKIVYMLMMISILSSSVLAQNTQPTNVFNTTSGVVYTDITYLQATLVNQDPSPADPGAYVNLLFKIENRGTIGAENTTLELIPEYPFSLDPGVSPVTELGAINSLQSGSNAFLVRYKVKVDKNAVNGDNEIKLKYSAGGSNYNTVAFNVSVSNPRTDFDVIAQDQSTLVIANIGANTAQSVIVSIPNQPNFRVNGTSASVLGNLNAGDYTLATFQLLQVRASNATSNIPSGSSNLTVEISYTDTLGIRRTIDKNVSYGFSASEFGNITGRAFTRTGTSQLSISNGLLYIIIGVVGIVIIVVFIKIKSRKKK